MTPEVGSIVIGASVTVSAPFRTIDLMEYCIPSSEPLSSGASEEMAYPDSTSVFAGLYVMPRGSEVTLMVSASEKRPSSASSFTRYVVSLKSKTYSPGRSQDCFR